MENIERVNKKTTKLIKNIYKKRKLTVQTVQPKEITEMKNKTPHQQKGYGEGRARVRLEQLKNKFINLLMRNGEKSKAYKLFAESYNQLQEKTLVSLNLENASNPLIKNDYSSPISLPDVCEHIKNRKKLFSFYTEYPVYSLKDNKNKKAFLSLGSIPEGSPLEKGTKIDSNQKEYKNQDEKQNINDKSNITKEYSIVSLPSSYSSYPSYPSIEQSFYEYFLKKNTLYQAVENIKPALELRRVRKGGTTYQVPAIVKPKRQERLAIKWIIESAEKRKKKNKKSFSNCLVSEILEAFNKTGQPRQRRDEQLKIAQYNRAYTRYRWW